MDYDQAIRAHSNWKTRLRNYIRNPDRSMVASEVARDDVCELGCWIRGHGQSLARLPAFPKLQSAHAEFHRAAAEIIVRANAGDHMDDSVTFGATSQFGLKSMEVVEGLLRLRQQAKEAGV
jgi:hypothetical protein